MSNDFYQNDEFKSPSSVKRTYSTIEQREIIDLSNEFYQTDEFKSKSSSIRRTYSLEQKEIIDLALPKDADAYLRKKVIRITAAAGTGKTTTLEGFANKLCGELGYQAGEVTYLTFSKAAAADAKVRLNPKVECLTIHAAALRALDLDTNFSPIDDAKMDSIILEIYSDDIDNFLRPVRNENSSEYYKKIEISLKKRVCFYIRRTYETFLRSAKSEELGLSADDKFNTYYPAQLWHQQRNVSAKSYIKGLPSVWGDFYVRLAKDLFMNTRLRDKNGEKIIKDEINVPYELLIKEVQLHRIPLSETCKALLVDESQDCTACQIDWLEYHRNNNIQVIFVGDAVQTIYSFRGAKSQYLMGIKDCVDKHLTSSYRFGKHIGAIANTILFIKEHSPQRKLWSPYRISGIGEDSKDIDGGLFPLNINHTALARGNVTLLLYSFKLLEMNPAIKISVNGEGENSGAKRWNKILKEMKDIMSLYQGNSKALKSWYQFRDEGDLTFETFKDIIDGRELFTYIPHIELIEKYKNNTMEKVQEFSDKILKHGYKAEEADVIISTIHAAKGMEWDNVILLDPLEPLAAYQEPKQNSWGRNFSRASELQSSNKVYEFASKEYGDELNLWYVGVTRACKSLRLPCSFMDLLQSFSIIQKLSVTGNNIVTPDDEDTEILKQLQQIKIQGRSIQSHEVPYLYNSLISKWIVEMKSKNLVDDSFLRKLFNMNSRGLEGDNADTESSNSMMNDADSTCNSDSDNSVKSEENEYYLSSPQKKMKQMTLEKHLL